MSATKRRCIVKRLDFENCIVTNIKTKARGRKRLRARITREFEDYDNDKIEGKESTSASPVVTQNRIPSPEPTSPVLIRKQPKGIDSPIFSKKHTEGSESPVLLNKRRMVFGDTQEFPKSLNEDIPSPPSSPVFKIKTKFFNMSPSQNNQFKNAKIQRVNRMNSTDLFAETNRTSDKSYQIEDSSQESKQNIHISSFESEDTKEKSSGNYSVEMKESSLEVSRSSLVFNPRDSVAEVSKTTTNTPFDILELNKKNYKKNSLLGKLQKVLRKQASEKLIWQHQRRKNVTLNLHKLVVVSFWCTDCNYFLKCIPMMETEAIYLIVDSRWVPNIKKAKAGSILQIYPPWHQLFVKECNINVLLNLICLEVTEEVTDLPVERPQVTNLESVPVEDFLNDRKLFTRTLFSSQKSAFLLMPPKKR